jgi:hypothetical protein
VGIVDSFLVDGREYLVPMALTTTEQNRRKKKEREREWVRFQKTK